MVAYSREPAAMLGHTVSGDMQLGTGRPSRIWGVWEAISGRLQLTTGNPARRWMRDALQTISGSDDSGPPSEITSGRINLGGKSRDRAAILGILEPGHLADYIWRLEPGTSNNLENNALGMPGDCIWETTSGRLCTSGSLQWRTSRIPRNPGHGRPWGIHLAGKTLVENLGDFSRNQWQASRSWVWEALATTSGNFIQHDIRSCCIGQQGNGHNIIGSKSKLLRRKLISTTVYSYLLC